MNATATATKWAPARVALNAVVVDNVAAPGSDELDELGRFDDDDLPSDELAPDAGEPDDDEPFADETDESDERPVSWPAQPQIVFWNGLHRIEWEIRPTADQVIFDDALAGLAGSRERRLERYAEGLATDLLSRHVLNADLLTLWNSLVPQAASTTFLKTTRTKAERDDWPHEIDPETGHLIDPETGERFERKSGIFVDPHTLTRLAQGLPGLEDLWDVGAGALSADRRLLVSFPSGRVLPLGFFTWKTGEGDRIVAQLAELPDLATITNAEASTRLRSNDSLVKKHANWVRAAKAHPDIVHRHRDRFRSFPAEYEAILESFAADLIAAELDRAAFEGRKPPGLPLNRRLPTLYRALAGGLS